MPILTHQEVERIKHEEQIRYEFRQELERNGKDAPANKSKIWAFLNSSFGLFLLGSVFLSGIGSWWSHRIERVRENEAKRTEERKLLAELDFRLNEIDSKIELIRKESDPDKQGQLITYIWRATRGTVDFQPALKEYKEVHLAGIIIQLDSLGLGLPRQTADAISASRDFENGVELVNGAEKKSLGGYRLLPIEYLEQRDKMLHNFRDAAWAKVDPDRNQSST